MKKILKSQKGFVGADIVIGLAVLMLFMVLLTTVYVNTNTNAMAIQRNAKATEIITNIFERIDLLYYDELVVSKNAEGKFITTEVDLSNNITANYTKILEGINTPEGYKIKMTIEPYDKEIDLVKKVSVTVTYNVAKKEESITMHKLKSRENIIVPNKPVLEEIHFPIKKDRNGNWVKTTENDNQWYNYGNNAWAYVATVEDCIVDVYGNVKFNEGKEPLVWIPAYGVTSSNEYKYLYSITGNATEKSEESGALLTVISDEGVTIPEEFENDVSNNVSGIMKSESEFKTTYEAILKKCK